MLHQAPAAEAVRPATTPVPTGAVPHPPTTPTPQRRESRFRKARVHRGLFRIPGRPKKGTPPRPPVCRMDTPENPRPSSARCVQANPKNQGPSSTRPQLFQPDPTSRWRPSAPKTSQRTPCDLRPASRPPLHTIDRSDCSAQARRAETHRRAPAPCSRPRATVAVTDRGGRHHKILCAACFRTMREDDGAIRRKVSRPAHRRRRRRFRPALPTTTSRVQGSIQAGFTALPLVPLLPGTLTGGSWSAAPGRPARVEQAQVSEREKAPNAGPESAFGARVGQRVANSAMRPRMPFRKRGLSSVDICLASSTASVIATGSSISET